VVVAGDQRLVVEEADLLLAEVALALGGLDDHAGARHRVADAPQQRLDPGRAEQRVVDVVEVRGHQVRVVLALGVLVGVPEDEELQLVPVIARQPCSASRSDCARRTCRGAGVTGRSSSVVRSHSTRTVPSCQGTRRSVDRSGFITKSP
jgi:hypothetical protein